jgi:Mg-chelatase subunit ChlD
MLISFETKKRDYIFLINNSPCGTKKRSMKAHLSKVQESLLQIFDSPDAIEDRDRVSLITFAGKSSRRIFSLVEKRQNFT